MVEIASQLGLTLASCHPSYPYSRDDPNIWVDHQRDHTICRNYLRIHYVVDGLLFVWVLRQEPCLDGLSIDLLVLFIGRVDHGADLFLEIRTRFGFVLGLFLRHGDLSGSFELFRRQMCLYA